MSTTTLPSVPPVPIQPTLPSPHRLPAPFTHTSPAPTLIAQGAEALVYRTHFLTPRHPCALKYRPSKPYRHPTLDARLTRHRVLSEARILVKCRREGVRVPGVLALDWEGGESGAEGRRSGGWMMMEWIEGRTIRRVMDEWFEAGGTGEGNGREEEKAVVGLMERVGRVVGRMHGVGVVHGDLTTSNLMLQTPVRNEDGQVRGVPDDASAEATERTDSTGLDGEIVLIDFGLAAQTLQDEDRAVDLYVLERAFGSTHPMAEGLFKEVLKAYGTSFQGAAVVLKRLEDVRMRGRKRSMLG